MNPLSGNTTTAWHLFQRLSSVSVSSAWGRVTSGREGDAAWCWGPLHQTGPLRLADRGELGCRHLSSDQQHVYVAGRHNTGRGMRQELTVRSAAAGHWRLAHRLEQKRSRKLCPHPHHEGDRAYPGWTMWESDRGKGIWSVLFTLFHSNKSDSALSAFAGLFK